MISVYVSENTVDVEIAKKIFMKWLFPLCLYQQTCVSKVRSLNTQCVWISIRLAKINNTVYTNSRYFQNIQENIETVIKILLYTRKNI